MLRFAWLDDTCLNSANIFACVFLISVTGFARMPETRDGSWAFTVDFTTSIFAGVVADGARTGEPSICCCISAAAIAFACACATAFFAFAFAFAFACFCFLVIPSTIEPLFINKNITMPMIQIKKIYLYLDSIILYINIYYIII